MHIFRFKEEVFSVVVVVFGTISVVSFNLFKLHFLW